MRFATAVAAPIAAILLAGCAGARVGLDSSAPPSVRGGSAPVPGTSYSSAVVRAEVGASPWFGLLLLGAYAAAAGDDDPAWSAAARSPPPLDADRAVVERDCTRPMDSPSANLRCR